MPVDLFISHSWAYGDAYDRLVELLDKAENFYYVNHSVPKDDPIHNAHNDQQLMQAIAGAMAPARFVMVLAGVYATYSKWINAEVALARTFAPQKPIIAIEPWGSERTSQFVKSNATRIVGWNTSSVVGAIRELER